MRSAQHAAEAAGCPPTLGEEALVGFFHAAAVAARREFHQLAAAALEAEMEATAGEPVSLEGLLAAQVGRTSSLHQSGYRSTVAGSGG